MLILYGTIEIFMPYSNSLKAKRKIVNSLVDRLRKRVNLSISEVDYHDLWQRSLIGFAIVNSNQKELEKYVTYINDTLFNYFSDIEITAFDYDIISIENN
ncbi:MAG: DUF503 domain-containing protein [Syntrophomonadaceae bacterium]|nr:DUF503 domain-containing protein [Syntrophomonadaceae bacterium]